MMDHGRRTAACARAVAPTFNSMASPPLVSVGIVTWNSAADLEVCLAAVRAQTWPRLELLIADNASQDGTRFLLEQLTSRLNARAFPRTAASPRRTTPSWLARAASSTCASTRT